MYESKFALLNVVFNLFSVFLVGVILKYFGWNAALLAVIAILCNRAIW